MLAELFQALAVAEQVIAVGAITAYEPGSQQAGQPAVVLAQRFPQVGLAVEIAARQYSVPGPVAPGLGKILAKPVGGGLGEFSVGGELAPEHGEQWCLSAWCFHFKGVAPGCLLGTLFFIVHQRSYARVGPDHILWL